jgi:hypothetical protein
MPESQVHHAAQDGCALHTRYCGSPSTKTGTANVVDRAYERAWHGRESQIMTLQLVQDQIEDAVKVARRDSPSAVAKQNSQMTSKSPGRHSLHTLYPHFPQVDAPSIQIAQ